VTFREKEKEMRDLKRNMKELTRTGETDVERGGKG